MSEEKRDLLEEVADLRQKVKRLEEEVEHLVNTIKRAIDDLDDYERWARGEIRHALATVGELAHKAKGSGDAADVAELLKRVALMLENLARIRGVIEYLEYVIEPYENSGN